MSKAVITITGLCHYYGMRPLRTGALVLLVKEPQNFFDAEAIRAEIAPIGKVGYVANSPRTVARGTLSAGRVYDRMGRACFARVISAEDDFAIAQLEPQIRESMVVTTLVTEESQGAPQRFCRTAEE